jgi:tetratricopeptide (TPR) repeat protein
MRQAGKITEAGITAALSLAQIYVDAGQAEDAIQLLEDATVGPLTLVKAGDAATAREGFDAETYKTALRAYISSLAGAADADAVIQKATGVMDAMKAAIDPQRLMEIYISLARDLEKQMELATPQAKQALSKGFETFLKRLRGGTTELNVLNWVGETFYSIASGFDTQADPTPDARKYYLEALATYQAILDKATFDDPKMKIHVRLRLAKVNQRLRKFTAARDIFIEVLKENEMMLNVQVEAAKMYQEWAGFPGSEALYDKAVRGAEPINPKTKKNTIWGWARLSITTARYPQFHDTFHESRYNMALCRFNQAKAQKSTTERKELMEKAKKAILQTQQLYGTGPHWEKWKPKYDALLKNIQKGLGETADGLPETTIAQAS